MRLFISILVVVIFLSCSGKRKKPHSSSILVLTEKDTFNDILTLERVNKESRKSYWEATYNECEIRGDKYFEFNYLKLKKEFTRQLNEVKDSQNYNFGFCRGERFIVQVKKGNLLGNGKTYQVTYLSKNDSIAELNFEEITGGIKKTLVKREIRAGYISPVEGGDQILKFEDINNDSRKDLLVMVVETDIHYIESYECWLNLGEVFQYVQGFSELYSPWFDKENNSYVCYQATGCADMTFRSSSYIIENFKVKLKNELYGDLCSERKKGNIGLAVNGENLGELPYAEAIKKTPIELRDVVSRKIEQLGYIDSIERKN